MNWNDKYNMASEYKNMFAFENKDEELEHEASIIAARFLSEVNTLCEKKGIIKKDLASMINTSASYITQVFSGEKMPNMLLLAKFQDALDVVFEIKAKPAQEFYNSLGNTSFKGKIISVNTNELYNEDSIKLSTSNNFKTNSIFYIKYA